MIRPNSCLKSQISAEQYTRFYLAMFEMQLLSQCTCHQWLPHRCMHKSGGPVYFTSVSAGIKEVSTRVLRRFKNKAGWCAFSRYLMQSAKLSEWGISNVEERIRQCRLIFRSKASRLFARKTSLIFWSNFSGFPFCFVALENRVTSTWSA